MRDAIALEKLGIPTACLISEEFKIITTEQRKSLGMTALEPLAVPAAFGSLNRAEVEELARVIIGDIRNRILERRDER